MRRQMRSEWRKIRTTRTVWGLLAGLVALIALAAIGALTHAPPSRFRGPLTSQALLGIPVFSLTIFSLVMGLRSFTDEFRHGSIVPTLLADPDRRRVLAAKLVVVGGMGIVFALVAGGVGLGIAVVGLRMKGFAIHTSASALLTWGRELVVVGLLWAAIGVGVGLALRHQVAAIVGCLVWITIGEGVLGGLIPKVAKFLPGTASRAIRASGPNFLGHVAAGLVLTAWMVVAVVTGAVLMQRRDIS
jgi:ABC-2 type transport system permease protein